jgi:cyanophycin synthetase
MALRYTPALMSRQRAKQLMRVETSFTRLYIGHNVFCDWPALHVCWQLSGDAAELVKLEAQLQERVSGLVSSTVREASAYRLWQAEALPAQDSLSLMVALSKLVWLYQVQAGSRLDIGRCRAFYREGVCHYLVPWESARIAREAAALVEQLLEVLLNTDGEPGSEAALGFSHSEGLFLSRAWKFGLDQTTAEIVRAAAARDIPSWQLSDMANLVRLGQGRHQVRIVETKSHLTSANAVNTSRNKFLTNQLLIEAGLPVPGFKLASSPEQAAEIAKELGFPLVAKPLSGSKGRGVTTGIRSPGELLRAVMDAQAAIEGPVMLEQFVPGSEYRLLVVGGKMVAAARRDPASVRGDGRSSVEQLVNTANRNEHRGADFDKPLVKLSFDDEVDRMLTGQQLNRESVPAEGQLVVLRGTSNIHSGGVGVDVTGQVNAEVADAASLAAGVIGLDIAGIDYITPDISQSPGESGGAIIEVNASPGLRPHWSADKSGTDVVGPIVDHLFPPGAPKRIPTAAVTGSIGKTTTSRMISYILMAKGYRTGLVCTDGMFVQRQQRRSGDMSGGRACQKLLSQPDIDAAVLEIARGSILKFGIGADHVDVAALIGLDREHIGQDGVETLEQMASVKGTLLKTAQHAVVINAADSLCLSQRQLVPPNCRLILFAEDGESQAIRSHLEEGGQAVNVEAGFIVARDGKTSPTRLVALKDLPALRDGLAPHNIINAMAAAAVGLGLKIDGATIARGLSDFGTEAEDNPGRLNLYTQLPFDVIIDLPVNRTNLQALARLVNAQAGSGRRIIAMTAAGNRPDSQLVDTATAAYGHFDEFVVYSWDDTRGRSPDELPALFSHALEQAGVSPEHIHVIPDQAEAYSCALNLAKPGDVVAIQCPDVGVRREACMMMLEQAPAFPAAAYREFLAAHGSD